MRTFSLKKEFVGFTEQLRWSLILLKQMQLARTSVFIIELHGLLMFILQNFLGLLGWFFLSNFYAGRISQALIRYNLDFVSYILLGILFSNLIAAGSQQLVHFKVYDPKFRLMYMTRLNPLAFTVISLVLNSFAMVLPEILLQIVLIFVLFKVYIPNIQLFMVSIVISLFTAVVNFVFYLSIDSLILHLPTLRTSNYHPVRTIVSSLTVILDGRYYPVEILPEFLKSIAYLLPGSNGLLAVRLYMAGESSYVYHLIALVILASVFIPISKKILGSGVERARKEGFVMSPLT